MEILHCTDSAEAFLDSDVHFVGLYVRCNIGYTLNGPNKCSKLNGAMNGYSEDNQVSSNSISVR